MSLNLNIQFFVNTRYDFQKISIESINVSIENRYDPEFIVQIDSFMYPTLATHIII